VVLTDIKHDKSYSRYFDEENMPLVQTLKKRRKTAASKDEQTPKRITRTSARATEDDCVSKKSKNGNSLFVNSQNKLSSLESPAKSSAIAVQDLALTPEATPETICCSFNGKKFRRKDFTMSSDNFTDVLLSSYFNSPSSTQKITSSSVFMSGKSSNFSNFYENVQLSGLHSTNVHTRRKLHYPLEEPPPSSSSRIWTDTDGIDCVSESDFSDDESVELNTVSLRRRSVM